MAGAAAPMFAQMEELSRPERGDVPQGAVHVHARRRRDGGRRRAEAGAGAQIGRVSVGGGRPGGDGTRSELDDMRRQLGELQRRIEGMSHT